MSSRGGLTDLKIVETARDVYQNPENKGPSFWNPIFEGFGERFWLDFGVILEFFWSSFGTFWHPLGHFGVSLGSFGAPLGLLRIPLVTFGTHWYSLGVFLAPLRQF